MSFDIEHQVVPRDELSPPGEKSDERSGSGCWIGRCLCSIGGCLCSSVYEIVRGAAKVVYYVGFYMILIPVGVAIAVALLAAAVAVGVAVLAAIVAIVLAALSTVIAVGVALAVALPVLIPLALIVVFSLPKKAAMRITGDKSPTLEEDEEGIAGVYNRARWKESLRDRIMVSYLSATARVSLVALLWVALSLLVPRLRAVALLGSPMWKWSLLGATLTAGYFGALTLALPVLLWPGSGPTSYYLNALLLNIGHVAHMGLVLGTWLGYFRTHRGLNSSSNHHPPAARAFEYLTWSIVSVFAGSILLFFKKLLLLIWGADAIYRRFGPRLLITSLKFYFIGLLAAGFDEAGIIDDLNVVDQYGGPDEPNPKRLTTVSKYVMSRKMSLSHLRYLTNIFISLAQTMSPLLDGEGDNQEVVNWFEQQIKNDTSDTCSPAGLLDPFASHPDLTTESAELPTPPTPAPTAQVHPPDESAELAVAVSKADLAKLDVLRIIKAKNQYITGTWTDIDLAVQNIFTPGAWKRFVSKIKPKKKDEEIQEKNKKLLNVLRRLVGEECSSQAYTFDDLKIWMVDAHKDCINMGRTLTDAKAIVTRLNIFMTFVIFVIVLLLWLLITGVSSTTVLVTVATPFLALTFIFGDSAKMFFQGFIFYFATHPFDVGDRCILGGVELEVRRVSILTTTFIKIGSKEKRMYPNSVLAAEAIINLGWQPEPKDVVELPLSASTNLDDLEKRIKVFFEEKGKCYGPTYNMVISEVGENIKVKVHFTHILTVHDLSHSRCFQKKSKQRSDFLSMIKKHVNESKIE